jgi:flagellar motor switch protein FliN/FliY
MSDDDQTPEDKAPDDKAPEDGASSPEETASAIDVDSLVDDVASGVEGEALADEWAAAMEESGDGESEDEPDPVQPAPMESFEGEAEPVASGTTPELDVILDIPVSISMEVGNTQIPIRNLLQLNQGSVVELDRLAGEPLDVLVNGTLIAHGEVVMVNDKFGIRLTDVISQAERIQKLK